MSNIIDSIQLSGTVYTISGSGGGGNSTVELTQAEYDALVSAGTVSANTYYIITDGQEINAYDYVKKADNIVSGFTKHTVGLDSVPYNSNVTSVVIHKKTSVSTTSAGVYIYMSNGSSNTSGYLYLNTNSTPMAVNSNNLSNYLSTSVDATSNTITATGENGWYITQIGGNNYVYFSLPGGTISSGQTSDVINSGMVEYIGEAFDSIDSISSLAITSSTYNSLPAINLKVNTLKKTVDTTFPIADNTTTTYNLQTGVSVKQLVKTGTTEWVDLLAKESSSNHYNVPESSSFYYDDNKTYKKIKVEVYSGASASFQVQIHFVYHSSSSSTSTSYATFFWDGNGWSLYSTSNSWSTYADYSSTGRTLECSIKSTYDVNRSGFYKVYQGNGRMYNYDNSSAYIRYVYVYTNPTYTPQEAFDYIEDAKQDTLSAGTNITISGNVISAQLEGGTVSRGDVEYMINEATGGLTFVKLTQSAYDALAPDYDANTVYIIKD